MRFTEQNTGGMKLCTEFIIVKFYDMYEVLNRCVFKLVLNLSYVSMFLTCSGRLFHNTGAAYENDLSPYDLVIVWGAQNKDFLLERRVIDDKSLPYPINNDDRSHARLLIFKIKFSSEPPTRWLTGSAEMTPVIGNARRVHGEVTLSFELVD